MTNEFIVLLLVIFSPAMIYFLVKAGRYGWLRANQLFVKDEFKRILKQKDKLNGTPRD